MRVNVNKVLERDQKLTDLDQRAGRPRHYGGLHGHDEVAIHGATLSADRAGRQYRPCVAALSESTYSNFYSYSLQSIIRS